MCNFPSHGKVAVIGGANMDITGMPLQSLVPADSNPGKVELSAGGVARNICENLTRLGVDTMMFTAVGNDINGKSILTELEKLGADTSHVLVSEKMSTSVYLSINAEDGDMFCAVSDMEIVKLITPEYLSKYQSEISQCQAVIIDANLSEETIKFIGDQFSHIAIFADPVSTAKAGRLSSILNRIHTLKPNRKEATLLSGVVVENVESSLRAAEIICGKGVQNTAISLGDEGLLISGELGKGTLKPKKLKIESANGAGDALMAGLILSYLKNLNLEQTLKVGCSAAAIALKDSKTVSINMTYNNLFEEVLDYENIKLY